ncbi:hypothetical protein NLX71_26205 [Paenibacillus sp. MZ04-78.2]|uniref:hypothetical protein n=1 Tax=Paenibacillus sp. MZ04-78.2 TaxID=2962034 RepID=UPI0020B81046|nr:hypothetical protein [Paenibacillus sp. MZ04-78.2]MCP3776735.1 hypothetical protein [Paenibacillus sp. MZ04-78.2]
MVFNKESDFEEALIEVLSHKGWESKVLKNPSEEDLIKNWADILFENNVSVKSSTPRKTTGFMRSYT